MTKKQKITGKKVQIQAPIDPLAPLRQKFTRLRELRTELSRMKSLYTEHDAIMAELLPLFVMVQADKITVAREITLGTEKYRFNPFFYDEKKGMIVPKVWKSSAFEAGTIE